MLPLLIPLIASAALSGAKAIGDAIPTRYDKELKKREGQLTNLQTAGQLGLTDAQRQARARDMMAGARSAEEQQSAEAARLMAQNQGGVSAGTLQSIGQATARDLGGKALQTTSALDRMDEAKTASQLNELHGIQAERDSRGQQRKASVFNDLSQATSAAGKALALPPESTTAVGMLGSQRFDPEKSYAALTADANVPSSTAGAVTEIMSGAGGAEKLKAAINGRNLDDPAVALLRATITDSLSSTTTGVPDWGLSNDALKAYQGGGQ